MVSVLLLIRTVSPVMVSNAAVGSGKVSGRKISPKLDVKPGFRLTPVGGKCYWSQFLDA